MINISNFSFNELTKTDSGLDNIPDDMNVIRNLVRLSEFLQIIRNELQLPIIVNSGYRSKEVNESVGGEIGRAHV